MAYELGQLTRPNPTRLQKMCLSYYLRMQDRKTLQDGEVRFKEDLWISDPERYAAIFLEEETDGHTMPEDAVAEPGELESLEAVFKGKTKTFTVTDALADEEGWI